MIISSLTICAISASVALYINERFPHKDLEDFQ